MKTYCGGTRAFREMEATCQDDRLEPNCFKRGEHANALCKRVEGGRWGKEGHLMAATTEKHAGADRRHKPGGSQGGHTALHYNALHYTRLVCVFNMGKQIILSKKDRLYLTKNI